MMGRELVLLVLLSACAFRLTRLIVKDTFPPVLWVRDRLAGGWRPMTEREWTIYRKAPAWPTGVTPYQTQEIDGERNRYIRRVSWSPVWLAELITCPWCASAYVSGALVLITDCVISIQWPWLMGGAVWAFSSVSAAKV
jgi:hypothetical protein